MRSPGAAFDLRAALAQELSTAIEELDAEAPTPQAVHRCRVRLKRARALARVGKANAPGLARVFNDSARSVMKALGQRRDLTALADTARALADKSGKKTSAALATIAAALEAERDALAPLDLENVRAGIKDLQALAHVWPQLSQRQVRKGAKHVARRARRAYREGRGARDAPPRHEWRKRAKDRYYAATLLGDAWPGRQRRKKVDALGQLLGREHDELLLIARVKAEPALAGDAASAERARRYLRKHARGLARRADRIGAALNGG